MAKFQFTSVNAGLVLQDDGGVWAKFVGGAFATGDAKLADRVRKVSGVTEVVDDDQPKKRARKAETAPAVDEPGAAAREPQAVDEPAPAGD